MAEPKVRLIAFSAALLIPQFAGAQVASRVEAGALVTDAARDQAPVPTGIWRVAPATSLRGTHGSLSASTSAWLENQNWQLIDGSIGGTLIAPSIYGVRAELIGNASRAFDNRSLGSDQLDVQTKINVQFNQRAGAWLGGGVARPWRMVVVSSVDLVNLGGWADVGNANFTLTGTAFSFTKNAGNNAYGIEEPCGASAISVWAAGEQPAPAADCRHRTSLRDLTATGHWNLDRFEFSGEAGHRFGKVADVSADSRYWASGTMTMWVAPRAAIVAGGGRQPSNPTRGIPSRVFGTLGMMLSYTPPRRTVPVTPSTVAAIRMFEAKPAGKGVEKIVVRVGGVESVEVTGDFNDWSALAMVRRGRDLWEVTVPMSAGIHEINIRTDGGKWLAPPGLPKTNNLFNGEVGMLIVR